jgi:hypothetical protein
MSNGFDSAWLKKMLESPFTGAPAVVGLHVDAFGAELVVAERATRARHVGREKGMQPDRQLELLTRLPDRIVHRVVELPPVDRRIGAQEDGDVPQLPGAPDDVHRARDVLMRDGADREEAARGGAAVVGQPGVVGVGLHLGELGIRKRGQAEEHGRIQYGLLDAFGVHVREPRLRVEGAGADLAVAELAAAGPLPLLGRHAAGAGERHPGGRPRVTVELEPLGPVCARDDLPDALAEARRCMLDHAGRWLEHVPIRVHDSIAIARHVVASWRKKV